MDTAISTAISIREATDADLPAVLEILNREIAGSAYLYMDAPVTLDERRDWFNRHVGARLPVLVATEPHDSAQILGWASLSPYRPSSGYRFTGEISIYVAPFAQRRGIGRQLLASLLDEARVRDMHALVASIDSENSPSIALFERHDFVGVARLGEVGRKFGAWRTQLLFARTL